MNVESPPVLSVVIPMFNEELNIEHAMNAAVEACTKYSDDYEIIIMQFVHIVEGGERASMSKRPKFKR